MKTEEIIIENLKRMNKTLWEFICKETKYKIYNKVCIQMYPTSHSLYNNIYNEIWIITWIKFIDNNTMYYVNGNWYFENVLYLIWKQ